MKNTHRPLYEIAREYHEPNKGYPLKENGHRPIWAILHDIQKDWKKPYFGAVPYMDAMASLDAITDQYMYDDARSIVRYFLANASSWRGETARRVKAELKGMLKG